MKKKEELTNSKLRTIKEGTTEFYIPTIDKDSIPSRSMIVFYNQKMEINRDVSNLAIMAYNNMYNQNSLIIVDSMAASGISSIRILKECKNVEKIYINDINPIAVDLIKKNLSLNEICNHPTQIEVSRKDANFLFSEIAQYPYALSKKDSPKPNVISIDPFGTPTMYIDGAFKAIQNVDGLLCITATDTPVLFGVRPKSCIRKYMSKPLHTDYCKEIGARILIYFISRIANVNKMGIIPLLSFYSSHFLRIFCLTFRNRKKISQYFKDYGYLIHCNNCGYHSTFQDNILGLPKHCPNCKEFERIEYAGPLWVNEIHEPGFVDEIILLNQESHYRNKKKINKLLNLIQSEIKMPPFYYNIHKLSKNLKLSNIPKIDEILSKIKENGYQVSRTHFDFLSIKTNMDLISIKNMLLEL